jgi:hypothetical protein
MPNKLTRPEVFMEVVTVRQSLFLNEQLSFVTTNQLLMPAADASC